MTETENLGYSTQLELQKQGLVPQVQLKTFTLEAGSKNIPAAEEAVKTAIKSVN